MNKQSVDRGYFAGLSRNTFLLAFASFFADISTEMLYPVLPIFLTQTLHAGGSVVGLVEGIAEATQNIVQGFSGSLSDKLQKRKPIALLGFLLAAMAKPLIGVSTVWQGVLGARFLDRFGTGTRSAPRDALIASSVDETDRGRAFGLEGLGDNAGAFLGPLVAVLLLSFLRLDLRYVFYFAFVPGALAFLMVLLVKERPAKVNANAKIELRPAGFPGDYWKYLFVTGLFSIGNSSNSFLILQTKDIGASLELTILIYACFNLVAALISYPAGFLSDRWGRRNILVLAFIIFGLTYFFFALAHNVVALASLFILYGVYHGTFRAVGKAFATDFVPERLRATAVGWFNTTVGLSGLIASIVAGLLWDHVGHSAVFVYGAVFALTGSIGLAALLPRDGGRR